MQLRNLDFNELSSVILLTICSKKKYILKQKCSLGGKMIRCWIRKKQVSIFIVLFFTLIMSGYKLCQAVFSVTALEWCFDPRISDLGQKSIIRFASENNYHDFSAFADVLKKQFPVIKDVVLHQKSNGVLAVGIKSITPKIRVNHQWVISEEGIRIRSDFFKEKVVNALNAIQECNNSALSMQWVATLPHDIFSYYTITWADRFCIWLQDKEQEHFLVLMTDELTLTSDMMIKIGRVKQQLNDQGAFFCADYYWIADVRFKDHIIVSKKRGEIDYGSVYA